MFYPLVLSLQLPIYLYLFVLEKADKLRELMHMHGMIPVPASLSLCFSSLTKHRVTPMGILRIQHSFLLLYVLVGCHSDLSMRILSSAAGVHSDRLLHPQRLPAPLGKLYDCTILGTLVNHLLETDSCASWMYLPLEKNMIGL